MSTYANPLISNALSALSQKAAPAVMSAIKQASAKTGVNFAYMVQQAAAESSFNPQAQAKTSSAAGLYQFIESTWMNMVKQHGDKHGLDIEDKSRTEILEMRNDPEIASNMAAEFASDNERFLDDHWGGEVGSTELYFAHFMGAGGAASFLKSRDENPLKEAALLFPKAAAANRNVFFEAKSGRGKTMDEVYAFFDKKFSIPDTPLPQATPEQASPQMAVAQSSPLPFILEQASINPPSPVRSNSLLFARTEHPQEQKNPFGSNFSRSYAPLPYQSLIGNPIELMLFAQLDLPLDGKELGHKDRL